MSKAKLTSPGHWTTDLSFLTVEERNIAAANPANEPRSARHQLVHWLLTDNEIGLAHYMVPDAELARIANASAALHEKCANAEKLSPEAWSSIYLDSERAYNKVVNKAKGVSKKDKTAFAAAGLNVCIAETLRLATYRNNENPSAIKGLVEGLVVIAGLHAQANGADANRAEESALASMKNKIFELLSAHAPIVQAA